MGLQVKTSLNLPFKGTWIVGNGGRNPELNNHHESKSQRFAYDFLKPHKGKGKALEDYGAFGSDVIAPAEGVVCQIVDGSVDIPPGDRDTFVYPGNMIVIDHQNGEWSVIAHFKHDSIKVEVGDAVKQGDLLGFCGNTGNTSEPHIHYHLQDNPLMIDATGLPAAFEKILVDGQIAMNAEPHRGQKIENTEHD